METNYIAWLKAKNSFAPLDICFFWSYRKKKPSIESDNGSFPVWRLYSTHLYVIHNKLSANNKIFEWGLNGERESIEIWGLAFPGNKREIPANQKHSQQVNNRIFNEHSFYYCEHFIAKKKYKKAHISIYLVAR